MKTSALGACLLLVVHWSATAASEWDRMVAEHNRVVARESGQAYERRLVEAHNVFWQSVFDKCKDAAVRGGLKRFDAIAVVDAKGRITAFHTKPDSAPLKCFRDEMVGREYPKPPVAPYYEVIRIALPRD
jgi:hypothetical protein